MGRRATSPGLPRIAPIILGLIAVVGGRAFAMAGQSSRQPGQSPRIQVTVAAAGYERTDLPVEVPIDLGVLSGDEDAQEPPAPDRLRVVEVDDSGRTIDAQVPHQFDPSPAPEGSAGTLVLLMEGTTAPDASRRYLVSPDAGEEAPPPDQSALMTLTEGVGHEGQESFRIGTPTATYFYHTLGGGFASLEGADGLDWLGYRPGGGSAGAYRGIPNLVHPRAISIPAGRDAPAGSSPGGRCGCGSPPRPRRGAGPAPGTSSPASHA
ncbi:hypothetical protein [Tautonia plasticadhaerens]|uniref:hypothetical protein n=1 Tax=Tautonia plasticadhaerens TaxID=2527974 RepID=UPI0011A5B0E7|nr:hypothetical protein [Tautonia plasticadhaerens]